MTTKSTNEVTTDPTPNSEVLWRNPFVLQILYCEHRRSLREIAEKFDCDKETIRNWLNRYEIETRTANDQKIHPCYSTNSSGYSYFTTYCDNERDRVGEHELAAIAGGADPHDVFSDETHCHHRFSIPTALGVKIQLDIPSNIEVIEGSEHLRGHALGIHIVPGLDELLDQEYLSHGHVDHF